MNSHKCKKGIVILLAVLLILEVQAFASLQASITINICGNIGEPVDPPAHIHLTWQSSDMATTISVTWQSSNSSSGNTVKYGTGSSNYTYSKDGVTPHTYSGASGYIHDVELTSLSPDTVYYFVCGGNTGGWSSERKFRTAPAHPTHVKYVGGGDCRTNLAERDKVSSAMRVYNPNFVLFGGDLVEVGTTQSLWDGFFTSLDSIWIDSNGFTIPIVPAIGNHEGNAVNYWEQFALPSPETWYSLDWGDLLHIIVLDTETTVSGTQLTWLQNDLATHQNFVWKVAFFHAPPYSSGPSHGSDLDVRTNWCPLFEQYHVQIVLAGHDHIYERSKPIYNVIEVPSYSNGTMYVVSGGWGAPLHVPNTGNWWTAYEAGIFNFVLVDALATGTLNYEAKNDTGTTFDQVQITTSTS